MDCSASDKLILMRAILDTYMAFGPETFTYGDPTPPKRSLGRQPAKSSRPGFTARSAFLGVARIRWTNCTPRSFKGTVSANGHATRWILDLVGFPTSVLFGMKMRRSREINPRPLTLSLSGPQPHRARGEPWEEPRARLISSPAWTTICRV
jgi:hypothetical protein